MRQALHIFRKDVRGLRLQLALVLLLVVAFAMAEVQAKQLFGLASPELVGLLGVLVPAGYAWLIVALVHQEALPGDRQFWLTRPYSRGSLLAAKAAFVVIFVSGSLVAKDIAILEAMGFPVLSNLPGLLLRVLAWTAWVAFPALAVATTTRGLQGVGLVGAALGLLYGLEAALRIHSFWPALEWVREYLTIVLLVLFCGAIVAVQYLRRATGKARAALAASALVVMAGMPVLPWNAAFTAQMLVTRPEADASSVQVLPDQSSTTAVLETVGVPKNALGLLLPVRLAGIPAGMRLAADGTKVTILSGGRTVWHSGWRPQDGWTVNRALFSYVDRTVFRSLERQTVTVKAALALTLLENQPPIRIPAHAETAVILGSPCRNVAPDQLPPPVYCIAAVRALPWASVGLENARDTERRWSIGTLSYAPYEAILDLSPLAVNMLPLSGALNLSNFAWRELWERPDAQIVVIPERPVAHFRRELEYRDIHLGAYTTR